MRIRNVRMAMSHRFVPMGVAVRPCRHGVMRVLVMPIVVGMSMFVFERLVLVLMGRGPRSNMASQLSGELPMALERRSAIRGETLHEPCSKRHAIDSDTPSIAASARPSMPWASRYAGGDELTQVKRQSHRSQGNDAFKGLGR